MYKETVNVGEVISEILIIKNGVNLYEGEHN